ncbi:FtsK/SpoIIIE domain-containing protein [Saccharopolyspora spinosa]|uniref:FtsK/SpoIIIE domain-containing protein n=1 Tax=Saccharopolyspora spinosa TaxID=60894 RepID=UPI0002378E8F
MLNLAANGLAYGVHVFVTAARWAEIRPAMKDLMQTRIELRLGDPSESEIDRKFAVKVPQGRPGRGMHGSKLHFLTALPRVDSETIGDRVEAEHEQVKREIDEGKPVRAPRLGWELYNDDVSDGVADFVNRVKSSWKGRPAPQVRLLPEMLPYQQLPRPEQQPKPKLVPVGINEDGLHPVYLDFNSEPNFYAFGERESGKTALLRTIVRGITERYTPKEALILLVDYRRTMLGFLNTGHLLEYAVGADQLKGNVKDIAASLKKRLPGPDVTQEQLKDRSWWKGPELFVIVDDYELVAPQGNNPLAPLAEFVPVSNDVGLHIVLARNSGGGSKSLYEPIIGKMRETSAPGLAMSANKDDGQLVANIKSRPLPPGRGTLVSRSLRAGPADDPDDSSRLSKGRCSRRTGGRTASPSDDRTDAGERQAAVSGIAAQYGVQPHGPARRGAASVGSARPRTATIVSGNSRSYDGVVMASHSIKIVFATLTCECVQGQRRCAGVSLLGASSADQAVARSSPAAGSLRAAG